MSEMQSSAQYRIDLRYDSSNEDGQYTWSRKLPLPRQLEGIPKDITSLVIGEDVPRDEEWEMMGAYFSSIEHLEVEAGWDESLNDGLMPLHWPLKSLIVNSSCGDVTQTPHILQGRLQHLMLYFTCGIRFEGPTSGDLSKAHREAVERGDEQDHHVTEGGIKITYLPSLADDWMRNKYTNKDIELEGAAEQSNPDLNIRLATEASMSNSSDKPGNLTHLEIIENDAIDTFIRFWLALPGLAHGLRTLTVRSTNGCDLTSSDGRMFPPILQSLSRLETLVLTLGEAFVDDISIDEDGDGGDGGDSSQEEAQGKSQEVNSANDGEPQTTSTEQPTSNTIPGLLPSLYEFLPPNVRTLRLRFPVSLTERPEWEGWISTFASPESLPHLSKLSIACDLAYDGKGGYRSNRQPADEERLKAAKAQVGRLIDAVRTREGVVTVEPFVEGLREKSTMLDDVDERWYRD